MDKIDFLIKVDNPLENNLELQSIKLVYFIYDREIKIKTFLRTWFNIEIH